jgi:mRNA interferase RelE/StbE
MAGHSVEFVPSAERALRRLPTEIQKRLAIAAEELADEPRPPGVKKLSGEHDVWRVRVGAYRMVYEIDNRQRAVTVLRVAHRKDAYRKGRAVASVVDEGGGRR